MVTYKSKLLKITSSSLNGYSTLKFFFHLRPYRKNMCVHHRVVLFQEPQFARLIQLHLLLCNYIETNDVFNLCCRSVTIIPELTEQLPCTNLLMMMISIILSNISNRIFEVVKCILKKLGVTSIKCDIEENCFRSLCVQQRLMSMRVKRNNFVATEVHMLD